MRKIKWDARLEHEFVVNFKVLQASFKLLAVDKVNGNNNNNCTNTIVVPHFVVVKSLNVNTNAICLSPGCGQSDFGVNKF